MKEYRAYLVGPDGHFQDYKVITAPDDRRLSRRLSNTSTASLSKWELDRKIAVLPSTE
jgi:hypothetical protein